MDEDIPLEQPDAAPVRARLLPAIAKWAGLALLAAALLIGGALLALNTAPGKRFIVSQIERLEFENGLRIGIGEMGGSIYGALALRDLTLSDPQGVFARAHETHLDWHPFALLGGHIDITALTSPEIVLERLPEFAETPPSDDPLLPDYDIDLGTLRVDRLVTLAPVSGEARTARIAGQVHIADGRAQGRLTLDTLANDTQSASDHLALVLDAIPQDNQLDIALDIDAPAGGMIAGLAGLNAPLTAKLEGMGTWREWNGSLRADLADTPLARLDIAARDGTFRLHGPTRPGVLLEGQAATLVGPQMLVDLSAMIANRRADLSGSLSSDALRLNFNGAADLAQNRFEAMALDLMVLRPDMLTPDLRGRALRAKALFEGAFATPQVSYELSAQQLFINDIGIAGLTASGQVQIQPDAMLVPVKASIKTISGLDSVAGGRLADITLEGTVAVDGPRILADDLALKSDRINAEMVLLADLASGVYTAAIDGQIDDYRIESVGLFNIDSDVDLEASANGGFALSGKVLTRSTRLDSEGVRDFLGGNVLAGADVRYGTDGIARLTNIRLRAPALAVSGATATYSPDGRIALNAAGLSQAYGPFGITMDGTLADPNAVLTAQNPGFGIGLANLRAQIEGHPSGYRLDGTAQTDYGPLSADLVLGMGENLSLSITHADWAGIGFSGALQQSAAGPFVGQLDASGRGLDGIVRLAARADKQEALINLRARNFSLEGAVPITIGAGKIDGRIILYDTPHVVAEADLTRAWLGGLNLNAAKAKLDYRNGSGSAQLLAEGESGLPFRLAANMEMQPDLWRTAVSGRVRGIAIKTTNPARIRPNGNGYELLPTQIELGRGTIALTGRFGQQIAFTSQLENIDIALADAFLPGLGLNGRATGSIGYVQPHASAFPTAEMQLTIANFRRTTADANSQAVSVNMIGTLAQTRSELRAVMRSNGDVIGRVVANLGEIDPAQAGLSAALMQARLGGGFRYNGPASTLFSFAGQADQTLTGIIGVAADFSGHVDSPEMTGLIRADALTYENLTYGTQLTNMELAGTFHNDRLQLDRLSADAGNGSVTGQGFASLSSQSGYPMDLRFTLENARLARGAALSSRADGQLRLSKQAGQAALLSGTLTLPETRFQMTASNAVEVPQLSGVRFKPATGARRITGNELPETGPAIIDLLRYDIALKAPDRLYISGMGLESEWGADLTLRGTQAAPSLLGQVELVRGTLDFAGRAFDLTEGRVEFRNGNLTNPNIRITASEDIDSTAVQINVSGRALSPQITFSSSPDLPQDEILARILFGSSIANLSPLQAVQLATSLNALRSSGGGGLNPLGTLRSATGIDRLRILGADEQSGRGTALAAGQYLTDDIYVEFITDARGFTATQLEIGLTPAISLLSQAGGSGSADVRLQYSRDY